MAGKHLAAWPGVTLLLLAAFALRIHRLDHVPLRGDEAYSVMHWTAMPFSERWETLWREEPAPVGAFTLFWAWQGLAGRSEFAMRCQSLLGTVAGLAVTLALARRLLRDRLLAALAGVLWAAHPYIVWHAQDARIYGLLSLLTPLAFYWLLRGLEASGSRRGLRPWLPYILVQTAALYVYYLEPFWLAAQVIYALAVWRGPALRQAVRAWIIVGVLALPVLAQAYTLMFVSDYEGTAAPAQLTLLFTDFVPTLLWGGDPLPLWAGIVTAALLLAGLALVARRDRSAGLLLLLWLLVPLLLLYTASLASDFFRPRYVTTVIPALVIALAAIPAALTAEIDRRWPGLPRYALPLALAGLIGLVSLVEVHAYFYRDAPKAPDWPGLMAYLSARMTPRDLVLFGQPDPAIEYYFAGPGELYIIPLDWPDPQGELDRLLAAHGALFMLSGERTGEAGQYLQQRAQHIPGDTYPNVVQYRRWTVSPEEIQHPLEARFGGLAALRGYTLLDATTLLLYWQALDVADTEHSILVHIEAAPPGAPPAAVLDHAIAGAVISMRTWTPGTLYRDPVALPADLAPGVYTIYAGVYESATQNRLPLESDAGSGASDARFPLAQITIGG